LVSIKGLALILISIGINAGSCIGVAADDYQKDVNMASETIEQVIKKHTEELMSVPGVVGVGQGLCDNTPCIKVYVIEQSPKTDVKIPGSLGGYKVSTEVTGEIRAHPDK